MLTLRRHRWKIAITVVVVALIAAIGLFIRSYNSGTDSAAPKVGPTTSGFTPSIDSTSSTSAAPSPTASGTGIPKGGVTAFTFPNGLSYTAGDPNFFRFQSQHTVVLRVYSTGNVQLIRIGWLAPESYDAPYGDIRNIASPWELTLHSSGTKYHAALFVGTARENDPPAVACEIYVDGKLADGKTAQYYGSRQVCVG